MAECCHARIAKETLKIKFGIFGRARFHRAENRPEALAQRELRPPGGNVQTRSLFLSHR